MKVLTFTTLFPNSIQPTYAVFVKERIKALAKLCEIKVVAPVPYFPRLKMFKKYYEYSLIPQKEIVEGLEVYHPRYFTLPKIFKSLDGFFMFFSILGLVLRLRRNYDFDLIDAHWAYPDGLCALMLAKLIKKPVTITVRGGDLSIFTENYILRKLVVFTLNRADRVICVCSALKNKAIELGVNKDKIQTIVNGVDSHKFKSIPKNKARKELGLPLNKKILLTVGRLFEYKGFQHLIAAMAEIRNNGNLKGEDVLLLIIGEGSSRLKFESQIKNLGLEEKVKLVGVKPHAELYKWYSCADLFCLASSKEGWPNVLFEALACGVPVVATKVWGIPEVITSDNYGILVGEQNGKGLAKGIIEALKRNWNSDALISYAHSRPWSKVAEAVFEEFKFVFGRRKRDEDFISSPHQG